MKFIDPDEKPSKKSSFQDPDETRFQKGAKYIGAGPFGGRGPLGLVGDGLEAMDKAFYEAGGKVTDVASQFLPPEAAAGVGVAANVGLQAMPVTAAGNVAKAASSGFNKLAHTLMRSALKPSATSKVKGDAAVDAMLRHGHSVSAGSLDAMKQKIGTLNDEVEAAIASSNASVNKGDVAAYTQDAVKKFENRPEALQAMKAAEDAEKTFITHPMQSPGPTMSVQDAQKMKRGYQQSVGERGYGDLKTPATEMDKAIARGLREKISAAVPEVAGKNATEAELINAAKLLQHRVAVEANKNPLGLGALISQPWMVPAWMWDRSAFAKSLVARGLYAGQEQIPATAARLGAAGLVAPHGTDDPNGVLYGR
jgi:hypothetical protein